MEKTHDVHWFYFQDIKGKWVLDLKLNKNNNIQF